MSDFEKMAEELSTKVANIPPCNVHIMKMKGINSNDEMKNVLLDLKNFLNSDLLDFQRYEKWLEDNSGPNKTR